MQNDNKKVIDSFLARIKGVRPKIGSLYLFGSRARGAERPDSDYDILVLVPQKDPEVRSKLYDAAVDVQLESGADISLKVVKQADFDRMKKLSFPFVENILKDGIKIG